MRDLKSDIKVVQSIAPATRTTNIEGTAVDRVGFESVTALVHCGDWTDGAHTFGADHSDNGSDWSAVDAAFLIGEVVIESNGESPPGSNNANSTQAVGYIGGKRYFRPKMTASGEPATGALVGVDVLLGHAHSKPTS